MANFYITLPAQEIAQQVATLLNGHNQLKKNHTAHTIMASKADYFVDIVGGAVVGCQATLKEADEVTKLFHLCVHPNLRRQGIARKLKEAALQYVTTPYSYVTVREDNIASINLNMSLGFIFIKRNWVGGYNILTLGRINYVQTQTSEMVNELAGCSRTTENNSQNLLFVRPN